MPTWNLPLFFWAEAPEEVILEEEYDAEAEAQAIADARDAGNLDGIVFTPEQLTAAGMPALTCRRTTPAKRRAVSSALTMPIRLPGSRPCSTSLSVKRSTKHANRSRIAC